MDPLVTGEWLEHHLGEPDLVVVDASWHMPASGRSGHDEYLKAHIPGARFLDIDAVSDKADPAPHMLPSAAQFGAAMEATGVGRADRVVVYDNSPTRTAARGWFMLRHFGAARVAILDGGFQLWTAQGRPTESGERAPRFASFLAEERPGEVVAKAELHGDNAAMLVDARSPGRFDGSEPDPRAGVASGHIPGARNLPYSTLYHEDGRMKARDEIEALFAAANVDPQKPFIATCGSGVTANSLVFAASLLGNAHARLYDGSWSEWGADPATPKAIGPA